ncbi:Fructosamine deglycase frlB [Atlantibacter hermannii]|nr:Fructosamine deglycase frlB [Atlantibacter hermannii]
MFTMWPVAARTRLSIRQKPSWKKRPTKVTVGLYNSGEFINNPPVALGKNAVVVVASHKGNTPETIKAAELAQSRGVPVIGLTWVTDSPLVAHCDFVETYSFGDGKDIAERKP